MNITLPLFSLLYILDIHVTSTRAILFVGLVEMRRYLEFKSLVSVGVVHADSTFQLGRVQYTETEIMRQSSNCYQGIDWDTVLLLSSSYLCCLCNRIKNYTAPTR
jgi:hypothetical protein